MGRLLFGKFCVAFAFAASLVVSSLGLGSSAAASPQWCEDDPVFMVNGALVDVTTAFPADYAETIDEPVVFELLVPTNAVATVVSIPSNVPTIAKISKVLPARGLLSVGVPVIVRVTVKSEHSFETRTKITGTYRWLTSTHYGKSNLTTQVGYTLIGR